MPIIQRGSMTSERSSLYMRSVPMLPDPTIAAVALVTVSSLSFERRGYGAEPGELSAEGGARAGVDRPGAGSGQDEVPGLELHPEVGHLPGQPGDAGGRVTEHGAGVATSDLLVAGIQHRLDVGQVDAPDRQLGRGAASLAEDDAGRGRVVGDG